MGFAGAVRLVARGLGQLLITLGLVILLFVGYELWFTNIIAAQAQSDLKSELKKDWRQPPPTGQSTAQPVVVWNVKTGHVVAVLHIPRLGKGYVKYIVQGVSHDDLKKGPGHYPGTAWPGQVGNFVVSGHRTTYGAPFNRLDELKIGDPIVIETQTTWFVYRVYKKEIVDPTNINVIYPFPDHPGEVPTKAYLTFTTCNPKYSAAQRLIIHAQLAQTMPKSAGVPSVLG